VRLTVDVLFPDAWNEQEHPRGQPENKGQFASTGGGGGASHTFHKGKHTPLPSVTGAPLKSWKPPKHNIGWEELADESADFHEPPLPKTKDKQAAGVILREPDGKVWLVHPTGRFGGYEATFPKGTIEHGMSAKATAIKEAYEESGLAVRLTGYAGDVQRTTGLARYYYAERVGGTPHDAGEESEAVTLASPNELKKYLNSPIDHKIVHKYIAKSSAPPEALDLSKMKKVGKQLGSNPGGQYEDEHGKKYYVKLSKSEAHAKNEILASKLYEAAKAPILAVKPVDLGDGKLGTATEWKKVTPINQHDPAQRKAAQEHFAAHAWLANWDAAGLDYDNQGLVDGKMTTLDPGGSLLFRAQGGPKGEAFGKSVGEWHTLRNSSNKQAHRIYGEASPETLRKSAQQVGAVSDDKIRSLVDEYGPGTDSQKKSLADKLIARRDDLMQKAGVK
jgi:8-oxo-dGTP pyrophosphatase MutT (NUDIX family)